jgi:hypothetical protein
MGSNGPFFGTSEACPCYNRAHTVWMHLRGEEAMASSAPFRDTQGKTIEDLRNKRGLSKRQLAQEIKCDDNTLDLFPKSSHETIYGI